MATKMSQVIISYTIPILLLVVATQAHNITLSHLLENHPSFSSSNHFLTQTHLANEINQRTTITVCAVNNAVMSILTSEGYTISTLKNIISFHVLLDYFDAKKLHQLPDDSVLTSTIFQATKVAPGTTGFVKIMNMRGGKIGFGPEGGDISSSFVKSIQARPLHKAQEAYALDHNFINLFSGPHRKR